MLNIDISTTYRSHAQRRRDRRHRATCAVLALLALGVLAMTTYLQV